MHNYIYKERKKVFIKLRKNSSSDNKRNVKWNVSHQINLVKWQKGKKWKSTNDLTSFLSWLTDNACCKDFKTCGTSCFKTHWNSFSCKIKKLKEITWWQKSSSNFHTKLWTSLSSISCTSTILITMFFQMLNNLFNGKLPLHTHTVLQSPKKSVWHFSLVVPQERKQLKNVIDYLTEPFQCSLNATFLSFMRNKKRIQVLFIC